MILNKKTEGTELYEIEITRKGQTEREWLYVYAKNRLDASNFLILRKIYGTQHIIRHSTINSVK